MIQLIIFFLPSFPKNHLTPHSRTSENGITGPAFRPQCQIGTGGGAGWDFPESLLCPPAFRSPLIHLIRQQQLHQEQPLTLSSYKGWAQTCRRLLVLPSCSVTSLGRDERDLSVIHIFLPAICFISALAFISVQVQRNSPFPKDRQGDISCSCSVQWQPAVLFCPRKSLPFSKAFPYASDCSFPHLQFPTAQVPLPSTTQEDSRYPHPWRTFTGAGGTSSRVHSPGCLCGIKQDLPFPLQPLLPQK